MAGAGGGQSATKDELPESGLGGLATNRFHATVADKFDASKRDIRCVEEDSRRHQGRHRAHHVSNVDELGRGRDRLSKLEAEGLVTRSVDRENARRRTYELTDEGLDLAPVLVEMILWSARHDPQTAADPAFVRKAQRDKSELVRSIIAGARSQRAKARSAE
jgi:hypothetical protein